MQYYKNILKSIFTICIILISTKVIYHLLSYIPLYGIHHISGTAAYMYSTFKDLIMSVYVIILLGWQKFIHIMHFNKNTFKNGLCYSKPLLIYLFAIFYITYILSVIISADPFIISDSEHIAYFIYYFFGTALYEELLFRGLIFYILKKVLPTDSKQHSQLIIILQALSFALMHGSYYIVNHMYITYVFQITSTFICGILLGTIYHKTHNIWCTIFIHGCYDFVIICTDTMLKSYFYNIYNMLNRYCTINICSILIMLYTYHTFKSKM